MKLFASVSQTLVEKQHKMKSLLVPNFNIKISAVFLTRFLIIAPKKSVLYDRLFFQK